MPDNNFRPDGPFPAEGDYGYGQRQPQQRPPQRRKKTKKSSESNIASTVKGIIAVLITFLIVTIIIMVFAKSLFMNESSEPKKTGVSTTPTIYMPEETETATSKVITKGTKKDRSDEEKDDESEESSEEESYQTIKCVSAVYLHPEPNSSSANLLTIPAGAEVKFYRNDNGWYYVDYNGTEGYAYGTFFSAPS